LGQGLKRGSFAAIATIAGLAACSALVAAPIAAAAPPRYLTAPDSVFSGTTISIKGGTEPEILGKVVLHGNIPIPGPNQRVTVTLRREGAPVLSREVPTDPVSGRYRLRVKLSGCCNYSAQAAHGTDVSDLLGFQVNGPRTLAPGPQALLFNKLLRENGYHMGDVTDHVDESTGLGIVAMRKVNGLAISDSYAPSLFRLLLRGNAGFEPAHEGDDRHVEVDLSRQVMALVDHGKATDVVHVSTGAFGTPTGEYSFYEKSPGYNAKGMYYSIYYSGNYATHGYSSVPYYPASHGCVRNPIPYAIYIYNWISLGDKMYVYE
jgi:hypothetical protein